VITLKQFLETINYKLTEGDSYGWQCYGPDAHTLSAWNGVHGTGGWSANIIFDTKNQTVYEVDVCDYTNERAYRLINPEFTASMMQEAQERGELANQAWDDVDFTDLEVEDDWLEKAQSIVAGIGYDSRIQIPLDFSDSELLTYMKLAHEKDITFNQLVVQALTEAIKQGNINDIN
jgi:shikimate 5-dehydrogenase